MNCGLQITHDRSDRKCHLQVVDSRLARPGRAGPHQCLPAKHLARELRRREGKRRRPIRTACSFTTGQGIASTSCAKAKRSDTVGEPCVQSSAPPVAQEGASNANGEAHVGARGRCPKLGHLAIQLGFANSIRSFCFAGATRTASSATSNAPGVWRRTGGSYA